MINKLCRRFRSWR